ncbi:MAG: thioesterase [Clostridiales bacterium]|nr:thioesterase [Clostridiales bacterium]
MYSFKSRIRYSETGADRKLTLTSAIDYFQDAAIFQSEDVGRGIDELGRDNLAWVMCAWQLEITRYPYHGENVEICTFPYGFRSFIGSRNCFMKDENGDIIIKANCIWTLYDFAKGRPSRVTDKIMEAYDIEEPIEMNYKSRHIDVPDEGGVSLKPITVEACHIDSLGHVNNGQYIKIAMNYRKSSSPVKKFRAEYKSQAHLGDIMIPVLYDLSDREVITLESESGEIFVTVEIEKE